MRYIIAIFVFTIFVQSCSDCNRIDCVEDLEFRFNFFSSQSNEDLVFGPNPIINKDDVRVYSFESGEKKQEIVKFNEVGFIYFAPQFTQSEYFVEAGGKIDTLLFTFERHGKDKCCGPLNLITQIRVNNVIQTPDSNTLRLILFR